MSDSVSKYHEMMEAGYNNVMRKASGDIVIGMGEPKEIKDKYVQQIKDKFEHRSQVGIKKYGTTLERGDLDKQDWLNHLEEELMDAILYLQVLKDKLK
jgi:hypothetical protein